MNILGHALIGVSGYMISKDPMFLIGSIIPDAVLLPNELTNKKFNKWSVKGKWLYDITHSLYPPVIVFFYSPLLSLSWLIHILIDIPFHTSSFRWKPFLLNRYKTKKKALLLSGGADSILCGLREMNYDAYFFDYGQTYKEDEYLCAKKFCEKRNIKLNIIVKKWYNDIEDRNIMMIKELILLGYDEVIIGTRNISSLFDRYGDSNWLRLKIEQLKLNAYINMPIVGLFKWQIVNEINNEYQFYSTEDI